MQLGHTKVFGRPKHSEFSTTVGKSLLAFLQQVRNESLVVWISVVVDPTCERRGKKQRQEKAIISATVLRNRPPTIDADLRQVFQKELSELAQTLCLSSSVSGRVLKLGKIPHKFQHKALLPVLFFCARVSQISTQSFITSLRQSCKIIF